MAALGPESILKFLLAEPELRDDIASKTDQRGLNALQIGIWANAPLESTLMVLRADRKTAATQESNGWSALHFAMACTAPLELVIQCLKANPAACALKNSSGNTPLHEAFNCGAMVRGMASHSRADAADTEQQSSCLKAEAVFAVATAFPEVLVVQNCEGETPLHLALALAARAQDRASVAAATHLLNIQPYALDALAIENVERLTPLHQALTVGTLHADVVRAVLRLNPSCGAICAAGGWLPLHTAIVAGEGVETVHLLLQAHSGGACSRIRCYRVGGGVGGGGGEKHQTTTAPLLALGRLVSCTRQGARGLAPGQHAARLQNCLNVLRVLARCCPEALLVEADSGLPLHAAALVLAEGGMEVAEEAEDGGADGGEGEHGDPDRIQLEALRLLLRAAPSAAARRAAYRGAGGDAMEGKEGWAPVHLLLRSGAVTHGVNLQALREVLASCPAAAAAVGCGGARPLHLAAEIAHSSGVAAVQLLAEAAG
eukprot:SAG11_NODE_5375_length_1579_cov_28.066216_1_plen_487_part_01